ncbi:hypothetical protein HWV62_42156 [Athelia sp. TMB]|nr:hypothetical protein HWV62_42156 [Athelia sp. TMB]
MASQITAAYPSMDGSIHPASLVDFHIAHNPALPAFAYSEAPGLVVEVSFLEFGRAAHRAAHLLKGNEGEVVALIANVDNLLYQTLVAGMMRAGLVPFPISPRNSPEAIVSLLQKTSCTRILTTSPSLGGLISQVIALAPFKVKEAPTISQCYPFLGHETASDSFEPYPELAGKLDLDHVLFYLHSSGSTGFPKPIPQTSRAVLSWCSLGMLFSLASRYKNAADPHSEYFTSLRRVQRIGAAHLPPFHTLGIATQLLAPLSQVTSIALYPPTALTDHHTPITVPTTDNAMEHAQRCGASALVAVPSFVEGWAQGGAGDAWLRELQFVAYAGGPLASKVGDALARAGVNIVSLYGATEVGCPTTLEFASQGAGSALEPAEWAYMRFSKGVNVRWVPQGDGSFESQFLVRNFLCLDAAVLIRLVPQDTEVHTTSVANLPDVRGYASSDLWTPHPTKAGLWKIVGRLDDVLILASGENMVPAPLESVITSSPLVSGAVVFGRGRNQVGVLIEPAVPVFDVVEFRNRIWPAVEEANKSAPTFARIFKEMILVTAEDKPLPRVAKGTVAKKAAVKLYESEIDALYETVESSAQGADVTPPVTWTAPDVEAWLGVQAADINTGSPLDADIDLFSQGFDSLSATFLRNRIMGVLRSSSDPKVSQAVLKINQNAVFSYPTIKQLAAHIAQLVSGDEAGPTSATAAIEQMIEKYSAGLTEVHKSADAPGAPVVLLTGSTGGLGSYMLRELLRSERVERVYAYNRPAKGAATIQERQKDAFLDKGFELELLQSNKLVYLQGDSALPQLGLADDVYEQLRSSVTVIIHNAWRLDFNLSLASFEPNIRGTRNLVDLASSSANASTMRFLFTSTIASSQGWKPSMGAFPEEVQYDASVAVGGGYGESKYVCERILAKSGLHATSFRIGQISGGAPSGAWATSDWVPSFVKSSIALGVLPDAQGVAAWLPMDVVSQAVLDVALSSQVPTIALNIVHPRPSQWSTIIRTIGDALHHAGVTQEVVPLIPFGEWLGRLEKRSEGADADDMAKMPAIKLLDFFRGMASMDKSVRQTGRTDMEVGLATLSTAKSQAFSKAMADVKPITADDARLWVNYWLSKGFYN